MYSGYSLQHLVGSLGFPLNSVMESMHFMAPHLEFENSELVRSSREAKPDICISSYRRHTKKIHYEELAPENMEAENFHDQMSAEYRPRKPVM